MTSSESMVSIEDGNIEPFPIENYIRTALGKPLSELFKMFAWNDMHKRDAIIPQNLLDVVEEVKIININTIEQVSLHHMYNVRLDNDRNVFIAVRVYSRSSKCCVLHVKKVYYFDITDDIHIRNNMIYVTDNNSGIIKYNWYGFEGFRVKKLPEINEYCIDMFRASELICTIHVDKSNCSIKFIPHRIYTYRRGIEKDFVIRFASDDGKVVSCSTHTCENHFPSDQQDNFGEDITSLKSVAESLLSSNVEFSYDFIFRTIIFPVSIVCDNFEGYRGRYLGMETTMNELYAEYVDMYN